MSSSVDSAPAPTQWLELLKAGQWEAAESAFLGHIGDKASKAFDYQRLLFIQGILDTGKDDVALMYMRKYEPRFLETEHKGLLLGWMARSSWKLGDVASGKDYGRKALRCYDNHYVLQPSPTKGCISFSLYGANPKYCETLILNAEAAPRVYPGYALLVHHDGSVPEPVLDRLRSFPCVELVRMDAADASRYPGSFWRFLALEDARFNVVLMRDADSIINDRDRALVDAWLSSAGHERFHIIREWHTHTDLILAGLWGARDHALAHIRHLMDAYIDGAGNVTNKHADQWFLAEKVWPLIRSSLVHHDSVFDAPGSNWPKDLATAVDPRQRVGGMDMQFFKIDGIPEGAHCEVTISEGAEAVCRYRFKGGQTHFELPMEYQRRLLAGRYKLSVKRLMTMSWRDEHGVVHETEVSMQTL